MNAEIAQKSGAARASKPIEPEWKIEDHTDEIEVDVFDGRAAAPRSSDDDDDLYGNMPFTD